MFVYISTIMCRLLILVITTASTWMGTYVNMTWARYDLTLTMHVSVLAVTGVRWREVAWGFVSRVLEKTRIRNHAFWFSSHQFQLLLRNVIVFASTLGSLSPMLWQSQWLLLKSINYKFLPIKCNMFYKDSSFFLHLINFPLTYYYCYFPC